MGPQESWKEVVNCRVVVGGGKSRGGLARAWAWPCGHSKKILLQQPRVSLGEGTGKVTANARMPDPMRYG